MKNQFSYPVKLTKQDGGYLVRFPDFPEAITQGEDIEDALREAQDCLEEAIANRIRTKLDIPKSHLLKKNKHVITLDTTFAVKTALYLRVRELKLTNTSLAKKLSCDEKEVRRLLDPYTASKLPRIEAALHKLGRKINIEVVVDRLHH